MKIENYKFKDKDIDNVTIVKGGLNDMSFVELNTHNECIHIYEKDAIALAKHFNLTSNSLL